MLRANLTKEVTGFIKTRQLKHQKQIVAKIQALCENPCPSDSKHVKADQDLRRSDVGEYRIIYNVADTTLFVDLVGKRNDDEVYRRLRRKQGR